MKKHHIFASAFLLLAIPLVAIAAPKYEVDINSVRTEEPSGVPGGAKEYTLPDNSDKSPNLFQATRKKLTEMRLTSNAKIRQIKLTTYGEYLREMARNGGGQLESAEVHPNRQMFLVDIETPEHEISTRDGRSQKLKNVRLKMLFDAETGQQWGNEITGTPAE